MALVGFSASAVQALTYQNGDYMGSLNKKASGAQCFIMALGLFWDIVTGLPWTPNGVGSLEPRGYCIFLPGAHYLTINSPYGADSSLNKLLLLLLTDADAAADGLLQVVWKSLKRLMVELFWLAKFANSFQNPIKQLLVNIWYHCK